MVGTTVPRLKVLFLCTGNSARSQIAEAVLKRKGGDRFMVDSAGSNPAAQVNPGAIEILHAVGIEWTGHAPQPIDAVINQNWDMVITVCDRAKEACPVFPGQPMTAHWGMPDPAEPGEDRKKAFHQAYLLINRRVDLLLALPMAKLERMALEGRLRSIGQVGATDAPVSA